MDPRAAIGASQGLGSVVDAIGEQYYRRQDRRRREDAFARGRAKYPDDPLLAANEAALALGDFDRVAAFAPGVLARQQLDAAMAAAQAEREAQGVAGALQGLGRAWHSGVRGPQWGQMVSGAVNNTPGLFPVLFGERLDGREFRGFRDGQAHLYNPTTGTIGPMSRDRTAEPSDPAYQYDDAHWSAMFPASVTPEPSGTERYMNLGDGLVLDMLRGTILGRRRGNWIKVGGSLHNPETGEWRTAPVLDVEANAEDEPWVVWVNEIEAAKADVIKKLAGNQFTGNFVEAQSAVTGLIGSLMRELPPEKRTRELALQAFNQAIALMNNDYNPHVGWYYGKGAGAGRSKSEFGKQEKATFNRLERPIQLATLRRRLKLPQAVQATNPPPANNDVGVVQDLGVNRPAAGAAEGAVGTLDGAAVQLENQGVVRDAVNRGGAIWGPALRQLYVDGVISQFDANNIARARLAWNASGRTDSESAGKMLALMERAGVDRGYAQRLWFDTLPSPSQAPSVATPVSLAPWDIVKRYFRGDASPSPVQQPPAVPPAPASRQPAGASVLPVAMEQITGPGRPTPAVAPSPVQDDLDLVRVAGLEAYVGGDGSGAAVIAETLRQIVSAVRAKEVWGADVGQLSHQVATLVARLRELGIPPTDVAQAIQSASQALR